LTRVFIFDFQFVLFCVIVTSTFHGHNERLVGEILALTHRAQE